MSREIKFRAWDKRQKRMIGWDEMIGESVMQFVTVQSFKGLVASVELMQYTGLKDKNGVEIYEGDICIIWNASNTKVVDSYTGAVEIPDGKWTLVRDGKETTMFGISIFCKPGSKQSFEVIGNIYSNPELLTPTIKANKEEE